MLYTCTSHEFMKTFKTLYKKKDICKSMSDVMLDSKNRIAICTTKAAPIGSEFY